jgi:hypothetical protein
MFVIQPFKILIQHLNKFENNPMNINKFTTQFNFKNHCYLTLQNNVKKNIVVQHCLKTFDQFYVVTLICQDTHNDLRGYHWLFLP